MEQSDREKLQTNYSSLIEVMYSSVSPHLISKFILDPDMHAEIETGRTDRKKMEKLLAILPTRGSRAMEEFIKALRPNYYWLANKLQECPQNHNNLSINNNLVETNLRDLSIAPHLKQVEKVLQKSILVCKNWCLLAHTMDLKPTTVMDIRRDMILDGGLDYAIHATLENWITKLGPSKATFKNLIELMKGEDANDVAEYLSEIWINLQE